MKNQLETQASTWQSNLTDSQKETEQTRQQVGDLPPQQPHRGLVMAGSNVMGSPGQQVLLPGWHSLACSGGWGQFFVGDLFLRANYNFFLFLTYNVILDYLLHRSLKYYQ